MISEADQPSERFLKRSVLAGDTEAWRLLYERTFRSVYGYVLFRTNKDIHLAEEVLQESWLIAVRRISSFDPEQGSFEAWMRGISDKVFRNQTRSRRRRRSREQALCVEPAATSDEVEVPEMIARALAALPARYQRVLRAKYEEGLSMIEISSSFRESTKAVESLLSRARAAFKKTFQRLEREELS